MPFDKFVDMETLSEERRKALQESLQSMTVAELRKIVKELSDFEGDPWQENFVSVLSRRIRRQAFIAQSRRKAQSYFTVLVKIRGVWFLPGSGMGPLPEEAKRHMKEAIAAPVSGRKQVRR